MFKTANTHNGIGKFRGGKTLKVAKKNTHKCPVYKCFKECRDEAEVVQHYEREHPELKRIGLELVNNIGQQQDGKASLVGRANNTLLT